MSTEIVPYTETRRDQLEKDLANKRELLDGRRHGLSIKVYWLRLTDQVSMELTDENANSAREFLIPNDKVMDAYSHPEFYASKIRFPGGWEDEDGS